MEHTELVEKYVKGEIDDAAFTTAYESLDTPKKIEVDTALRAAKPSILSEISGLRKEREKVKEQKIEAEKPPVDFMEKFRAEQVEKAKRKLFADFEVEDKDRAAYDADFARMDDGAVDADLIFENLKRIYAARNVDKLLSARNNASSGASGAADYIARQAGGAGKSGSPSSMKEDDPRVTRVVEAARREGIEMTADEARRGLEAGMKKGSNWGGLKPLPKSN